jgi:hypothetical protein
MLKCKTCNEIRNEVYFNWSRPTKDSRKYYKLKACKVCLGHKIQQSKIVEYILSPEIVMFLNDVKRKRYYLEIVDCYRLAHYHIEVFGYKETNMSIDKELTTMYKELRRLLPTI